MQSIRVGFLTLQNYLDKNAWSGTLYYMQKALREINIDIVDFGVSKNVSLQQKVANRVLPKRNHPKLNDHRYFAKCKKFNSEVQKKLHRTPCDVIFAPVASAELTFLDTKTPIIYLSDITFSLYKKHSLLKLDRQESEWTSLQESVAISKASQIIYSSQWAAESAIYDYQTEANKIRIIPFGANLDKPPARDLALSKRQTSTCRLLFVGKDWYRKGGQLAYETLLSLCQQGVNAELIVVGCMPPAEIQHEKLTVIPDLDTNHPQQRAQLDKLFLQSNFLILPTRADCTPVVLCEANAFGLPVITTDVGGISSLITNGKNGYALTLLASGEDYAKIIGENFSDVTRYENLVRSSRDEYELRLNWNKWAESVQQVMVDLLEQKNLQQQIAWLERLYQQEAALDRNF